MGLRAEVVSAHSIEMVSRVRHIAKSYDNDVEI